MTTDSEWGTHVPPRGGEDAASGAISAKPSRATFRLTDTTPRTPHGRGPSDKAVLAVGGVRHTDSPRGIGEMADPDDLPDFER